MIDISRRLSAETAPWPGDTPFSLSWVARLADGDDISLSRITLSPHVGTHADAPAHYQRDGVTTEAFELTAFIGPVRVVDGRGGATIGLDALEGGGAIGCERVLVRTLDQVRPERFVDDFPPLDPTAAESLVREGLRLYGTDAPSVDPVDSPAMSAHRALGSGSVPILENLDLSAADPGDYDLLALPMPVVGAEAAPVRAILLPAGSLS